MTAEGEAIVRILVVEDDFTIRKALTMGLSSAHWKVDTAPEGRSGVRLGTQQAYDVLIVDLGLPDMDGLEVIRALRGSTPDIVSMVITGGSSPESFREASRIQVSAYLEKPFRLQAVREYIHRALEQRQEESGSYHFGTPAAD